MLPRHGVRADLLQFYVGFGWLLAAYAACIRDFWRSRFGRASFPASFARSWRVMLEAVCAAVLEWKFFLAPSCFSAMRVLAVAWRLMRPGTRRWCGAPDTGGSRRTAALKASSSGSEFPFREESGFDPLILAVRAHVFEVEEVRGAP